MTPAAAVCTAPVLYRTLISTYMHQFCNVRACTPACYAWSYITRSAAISPDGTCEEEKLQHFSAYCEYRTGITLHGLRCP